MKQGIFWWRNPWTLPKPVKILEQHLKNDPNCDHSASGSTQICIPPPPASVLLPAVAAKKNALTCSPHLWLTCHTSNPLNPLPAPYALRLSHMTNPACSDQLSPLLTKSTELIWWWGGEGRGRAGRKTWDLFLLRLGDKFGLFGCEPPSIRLMAPQSLQ